MIMLKKQQFPFVVLMFCAMFLCNCSNGDPITNSETEEVDIVIPVDDGTNNNDNGSSDGQDNTDATTSIVWENWYLSVPIERSDASGKATSIFSDDIINDNFSTEEREYFYKNSDDSYTLYTKFTGFTTSGYADLDGGKYCRTELREFWQGNIDTYDNWYMDDGSHMLESTLRVNYCEGNGRTFVAQIHAKSSTTLEGSPATIKVEWRNGDIIFHYYTNPDNGIWTSQYDEKVTIGTVDNEKFTIKLKAENGIVSYGLYCEAKNIDIDFTEAYNYAIHGYNFDNYFKTGNYFVWNSDYEEAAEVILYEVKTVHN